MIYLNDEEKRIKDRFIKLKSQAGTHSPSISTLRSMIPEISIGIDACFLSNPYATDLFLENLRKDLIKGNKLRDFLEYYPSQNNVISNKISEVIHLDSQYIFVGNGAIEIIQAIIHKFVSNKLLVILPTFSSYYEFIENHTEVIYFNLKKENDFELSLNELSNFIYKEKPDSVVIINPNNPNGSYIKECDLITFFETHKNLDNIIIDESFIHFAYESDKMELKSVASYVKKYSNLIVIKSMSKDFGIAGVRAGYGVMSPQKVNKLLKNGYLWNSNGLSEYFFDLYSKPRFQEDYELIRKNYILESRKFYDALMKIPSIKAYPTMANFALIELLDGSSAEDFVFKLLISYGIYTRVGSDKIGLDGEFVRIASRTKKENEIVLKAILDIFNIKDK